MYPARFLPLLLCITVLGHVTPTGIQAAEVSISPKTQRFINGVSELERRRYFNISTSSPSFWKRCPPGEAAYLLDDLHVSYGRGLGLGSTAIKAGEQITEDPTRPGYADPSVLRRHYANLVPADSELQKRFGDTTDVILHESDMPHPAFMGSALHKDGHYQRIAADPQAASDFIVQCLKLGYDDFTRPRYYEPLNEPSWEILRTPQFPVLHTEIAKGVRQAGLNVKVGGPCLPVGYMYSSGYEKGWNKMLKPFIDAAGRELDFISFHIYDYYTGPQQDILTGLPLENVFDLYEAYTLQTLGEVKPFACSEHGATGANFNLLCDPTKSNKPNFKGVEISRAMAEWLHINSLNGQVMTFMERPTTVLKTVPHILDRTDDWNPRYVWSLFARRDYSKSGELERTGMFGFYQLWKEVRGNRIESNNTDPDVQTCAFSEGNTVFLCLKNLADKPKTLSLTSSELPAEALVSRYYLAADKPVLETDVPVHNWQQTDLRPNETAIFKLRFAGPIEFRQAVNERKFYSDKLTAPIKANVDQEYQITAPATAQYATLRIGVSRPQTAERTPVVLFNGKPVEVPMEEAASSRETSNDYATTKLIKIEPGLLKTTNHITVTFPDDGGAIGSVALLLGEEK